MTAIATTARRSPPASPAKSRPPIVRPFDDPDIIAGQGTIGREVFTQLADICAAADVLLSPCGGGGLVSGIALAMAELSPKTKVHAVEPALFDDTARSLAAHSRLKNPPDARSICDALLSPMPGELTFQLNDRLLAGALGVTDDEVLAAMDYAFRMLKLVTEPGGAVALAAVAIGQDRPEGQDRRHRHFRRQCGSPDVRPGDRRQGALNRPPVSAADSPAKHTTERSHRATPSGGAAGPEKPYSRREPLWAGSASPQPACSPSSSCP